MALLVAAMGCGGTEVVGLTEVEGEPAPPGDGESAFDRPECEEFLDIDGAVPVELRIRNRSDVGLSFRSNQIDCAPEVPLYELASLGFTIVSSDPWACVASCEKLQAGPATCLERLPCSDYPLTHVVPGGAVNLTWWGWQLVEAAMPSYCYALSWAVAPSCPRRVAAPAGEYALTVHAFAEVACESSDCTCAAGPSGTCGLFGHVLAESERTAAVTFQHPDEAIVTIDFE